MIRQKVTSEYLSDWLGVNLAAASHALQNTNRSSLSLIFPGPSEQLQILKKCQADLEYFISKPSLDLDKKKWEARWQEVLMRVVSEGVSEDSLQPVYFGRQTLRLHGKYAHTDSNSCEYSLHLAILKSLFLHHLKGKAAYTELGSGTGINLYLLSRLFPNAVFYGADWSETSAQIIRNISESGDVHLDGGYLNLRTMEGADGIQTFPNGVILTIHGLEQIGTEYESLLSFLLEQHDQLIFHIEPLLELYDLSSNFDMLAATYHRHLGYLEGYLPALKKLERNGVIKILECKRLGVGDKWHEAYGLVIWHRA